MTRNDMYFLKSLFTILLVGAITTSLFAQSEKEEEKHNKYIAVAQEMINEARYCAFISLDSTGHPQARTMDAISPEDDMIVWLATNKYSRKVQELRKDSRVTLYFQVPQGYVTLIGTAYLIQDEVSTQKYWKEEWTEFYPRKEENFLLIKVVPKRMEIVSYKHGIVSNAPDWKVPAVMFE